MKLGERFILKFFNYGSFSYADFFVLSDGTPINFTDVFKLNKTNKDSIQIPTEGLLPIKYISFRPYEIKNASNGNSFFGHGSCKSSFIMVEGTRKQLSTDPEEEQLSEELNQGLLADSSKSTSKRASIPPKVSTNNSDYTLCHEENASVIFETDCISLEVETKVVGKGKKRKEVTVPITFKNACGDEVVEKYREFYKIGKESGGELSYVLRQYCFDGNKMFIDKGCTEISKFTKCAVCKLRYTKK